MPKKIYLIRHPQTEAPPGICYGNSDVLVQKEALEQSVQKVLEKLNGLKPDICYSSPLSRCKVLADELVPPIKTITSERLREIDFARWEMTPWADIPEEEQKEWGQDFVNCKIHGGENFFDVQRRVISFWQELVQSDYQDVLVVSHAGLLRSLLAWLLDSSPKKIFAIQIDYGDVIRVEWHNENYYKIKYL